MAKLTGSKLLKVVLFLVLLCPGSVFAGDAATLIFESGLVVKVNDGFRQLVSEMKKLNSESQSHQIVELDIGGSTFLVNMSEVVVICRDDCKALNIKHKLDPKRSK